MNAPVPTPVLLREDADGIAVLTLNRPQARNSLSEALIAALTDTLAEIANDKRVRVVVLTANGPAFSAGHDMKEMTARRSDALDLQGGVFKLRDPKKIAASLKRSAERSKRRKADPYRSALSMLTFYINRAGESLPKSQRDRLQRAKSELKHQFGKD